MSRAGYCFSRLKVNSTSEALIGWPSLHLTPSRIVKVRVLLSADHLKSEASIGVVSWFFSALTKTSGSYTGPNDTELTAGLNGLNPQVHVWPWVLAIVTTPDWPPELPPDELVLSELLPHETTKSPAAATTATYLRLFMRFP